MSNNYRSNISVFHMNIRKFSKHRGEPLAYLKSLENDWCNHFKWDWKRCTSLFLFHSQWLYKSVWAAWQEWVWCCCYMCKPEFEDAWEGWFKAVKTCKCSKCNFKSVWVDVIKHNDTFTVGGVYWHPGGNTVPFNTAMEVALSKVNKNDTCIMMDDMNINLLNIDGTITTYHMSSAMSLGFVPYITRPTRITKYSATIIDHFFVRLPRDKLNVPVNAGILFNDITDHLPIFMFMSIQREGQSNQRPGVRIFSDTNIQKFVDKIVSVNWCHISNQ